MKDKIRDILMVTPIYPNNDGANGTPVVHYFVREWVKSGYNVRVLTVPTVFPSIYYSLAKPILHLIESTVGYVINVNKLSESVYEWENVKVYRVPMKKAMPHGRFSKKVIQSVTDKATNYLQQEDFIPDIIIGHWANPTAELLIKFKQIYQVPCCMVMHDDGHDFYNGCYKKCSNELLSKIDLIGFRSLMIKQRFEQRFGPQDNSFMCYSGVSTDFINSGDVVHRTFDDIKSFVFVGSLIKRKYPLEVLKALEQSHVESYTYNVIGKGAEGDNMRKYYASLDAPGGKLNLIGHINRNDIISYLDNSDIFVMISRNETFGLVYLEAMARGCIAIASKGEGFDGIIIDGVNGFLCKPGDVKELTGLVNRLVNTSPEALLEISKNGTETATKMTDKKVAEDYIDNIISALTQTA